jgi:hypothetical protein
MKGKKEAKKKRRSRRKTSSPRRDEVDKSGSTRKGQNHPLRYSFALEIRENPDFPALGF